MRRKPYAELLLVLLVAALGGYWLQVPFREPVAGPTASPAMPKVDSLSLGGLRIGDSSESVLSRLGRPSRGYDPKKPMFTAQGPPGKLENWIYGSKTDGELEVALLGGEVLAIAGTGRWNLQSNQYGALPAFGEKIEQLESALVAPVRRERQGQLYLSTFHLASQELEVRYGESGEIRAVALFQEGRLARGCVHLPEE